MCLCCDIYALVARLSPTIQGPCCSCVCRVIPVPCLGSGFLRCHCRRALSCSTAACTRFFFGDGADPSMAAHFSEPRAASPGSFCVHLLYCIPCCSLPLLLPCLPVLPPCHGLPPCSIAKRKKKKRAKKEDRRKQRQQERTEKGKKTDLGGLELPSSVCQPEWLKKATPHP